MSDVLLHGTSLVTEVSLEQADVLICGGVIDRIAFHADPNYALPSLPDVAIGEIVEAEGLLLFPGLIDCHVHFREPGLEHKGTMKLEAAAARAGGVTTVCEMPNTNPPTVSVAAFADKVKRASAIGDCDIRFFFGVTEAAHLEELVTLWTDPTLHALRSRCSGVKLYLDHSTGNQKVEAGLLDEIFAACAQHNIPIIAHCEDPDMNARAASAVTSTAVSAHSAMRPSESEAVAVARAIALTRKHGNAFHVAHLSTKEGLGLVREAKSEGLPITCEVAPHHLFLTVDDYATLGTFAKMNPPLRTAEHRDALWEGLEDGAVDCIATDHAPHTLEEKKNAEPLKAPSGVPGVETMLPLLLSVAAGHWPHPSSTPPPHALHVKAPLIRTLCFEAPNRIFNLQKSAIAEGAKADLVLVDPEAEWTIHGKDLHGKCGWTPYEGWKVKGKVDYTSTNSGITIGSLSTLRSK